jgi:pimeloyl-ACP methyl ester carboxylesterase
LLNWQRMKHFLQNLWRGNGFLWRTARIMLMVCVVALILIMAFEDKLIYFPGKYPEGSWTVRETCVRDGEIIPRIEDCHFRTSDGITLHGWYSTPLRCEGGAGVPVKADMVVLWFHGNAGNISHRYDMIRAMIGLPVQVFIIDYRGYGKSEGKPNERGLYLDARAAWNYLINERRVAPDNIVIFGKSLGGAPAIDLATQVEPAGLIVQSSFTSAGDMAATILPFLPRFVLHTKMDSLAKISQVRCPKLFIHSRADEVVPYELGRRLYEAAPEPKEFYEVKGSPHNSTYIVGGKPYFEALRKFVASCRPSK